MDSEVDALLNEVINRYKKVPYSELKNEWVLKKKIQVDEVKDSQGNEYQIEYDARWDNIKQGSIRFFASIDNGKRWFKRKSKSNDFIILPDGKIIN